MKVSTKGRYALRVMVALASQPDARPISLRAVAEQQHLTLKYLESIIALLLREQLVVSVRGKTGGYVASMRMNSPVPWRNTAPHNPCGAVCNASFGTTCHQSLWRILPERPTASLLSATASESPLPLHWRIRSSVYP